MRLKLPAGLLLLAALSPLLAQTADPATSANTPIVDMAPMVVSGVQPGPGMWKVSKGGHVLWVLGVQSPLPKKIQWHSPPVEAAIAQSQESLSQPGVGIGVTAGGMLRAAFAIPTLLKARKLPEGQTLQHVLPADLYARWARLKPQYLGQDKAVEQMRPVFAAQTLYDAALSQAGLEDSQAVSGRVLKLAKQHDLKLTSTSLSTKISRPKAVAKSLVRSPMADVGCFREMLDRLEDDVAGTVARANAWAVGDVDEMTRLAHAQRMEGCSKAVFETEALRDLGLANADAKVEAIWLQAAEAALAKNPSTFALLSVEHLLSERSYLAKLAAKGYTVEAPN